MELTEWPDVAAFVSWLESAASMNPPVFLARAPGRLDVMGGIADYSGSLVLQLPLREAACVALQRCPTRRLDVVSLGDPVRQYTTSLDELMGLDFDAARAHFRREPSKAWAAYVAGAMVVLMQEKRAALPNGARIMVRSDVPEGKGVASSAALAVASMTAIDAAYDVGLEPRELAFLAQKVENRVVGAPCGIMDQTTAVFGDKDRLLALLCQPAEIQGSLAIPEGLAFWGIDSGVAHTVSGEDYTSVRIGTFMGYRILQALTGRDFDGFLANLTPSELDAYRGELPDAMSGAAFLARYGGTSDPVTRVDPSLTYPVREPTAHPVSEHFRIRAFGRLLRGDALENAPILGELMYQSHASYSACGLGSQGTDRLVELARAAGPRRGIFGAKITGGGSGGTVAVLARRDAEDAVRGIADRYARERGIEPTLFSGSSSGALAFGHRVLKP
ncbi:MAG TPA: GHMP kinase [Vicinamibacteria bacterium]|nr:GHMP kinase [Vicinamibacteria bacterium]